MTEARVDRTRIRHLPVGTLTAGETAAVRRLLWAAFADSDPMEETDWARVVAGDYFAVDEEGEIVAFASVAERRLYIDGEPIRAGYVEGVAVVPGRQGSGLGSTLMQAVDGYIAESFELGALGTGVNGFYERLGWKTWQGKSSVRTADGSKPTPEEDGFIMVLPTRSSPALDLTAPIECEGLAW
jgi:aminoglycoside 2'-N-acetyltransferase I